MDACRKFCSGGGGGGASPKKPSHMKRNAPHRKKKVAKSPPTGEKRKKKGPHMTLKKKNFQGGGGAYAYQFKVLGGGGNVRYSDYLPILCHTVSTHARLNSVRTILDFVHSDYKNRVLRLKMLNIPTV